MWTPSRDWTKRNHAQKNSLKTSDKIKYIWCFIWYDLWVEGLERRVDCFAKIAYCEGFLLKFQDKPLHMRVVYTIAPTAAERLPGSCCVAAVTAVPRKGL